MSIRKWFKRCVRMGRIDPLPEPVVTAKKISERRALRMIKAYAKRAPLRPFIEGWIAMLWRAMTATAKGYRRHCLGNTGKGNDRRKDKLACAKHGVTKRARQYFNRYAP